MKYLNPTILVMALLLFCALLIPVFLNWNAYVLIFIFLAFSTFSIGYLFARQENLKELNLSNQVNVLDLLVKSMGEILIIHQMEDHGNIFVSPEIKRILGYDPNFIRRKFTTFIVHPDDRKFLVPRLKMEQLLLRLEFELPLRIRRMDGTYLTMLVKGKGIKNKETGLVTHTLLVFNHLPTNRARQKSEGMTWKNKMIPIE
jgi:PAS fold.